MDGTGCALAEGVGFSAEANRNGKNSATVRLCGQLDIASVDAGRRALEQLDAGIQQVVLHLSHITIATLPGYGSCSPLNSKRAPQAGTWLPGTPAGPCGGY